MRLVAVPATLFPPYRTRSEKISTKKLIEEVADSSVAQSGSKKLAFASNTLSEGSEPGIIPVLSRRLLAWTQDNSLRNCPRAKLVRIFQTYFDFFLPTHQHFGPLRPRH
jgi:hypothetical protein